MRGVMRVSFRNTKESLASTHAPRQWLQHLSTCRLAKWSSVNPERGVDPRAVAVVVLNLYRESSGSLVTSSIRGGSVRTQAAARNPQGARGYRSSLGHYAKLCRAPHMRSSMHEHLAAFMRELRIVWDLGRASRGERRYGLTIWLTAESSRCRGRGRRAQCRWACSLRAHGCERSPTARMNYAKQ